MDYSEKFDRAVRSVTGFLAGYVRQDSLALLDDESIPNTGIVVFKKDGPGRIAIYTDVTAKSAKPKAALIPGELLGYQTAAFLAAAGIPHDRVADHSSEEWKLFMAGFDLAARLADRLPSALSDTQAYRTGCGEGVRAAAKLAEASAPTLAEAIRNLQSAAPAAASAPETQPADDDLLKIVRCLCTFAARRGELPAERAKNYPHVDEEGSPLLSMARAACVARGYTEDGLSVEGVAYPVAAPMPAAQEQEAK